MPQIKGFDTTKPEKVKEMVNILNAERKKNFGIVPMAEYVPKEKIKKAKKPKAKTAKSKIKKVLGGKKNATSKRK